MDFKSANLKNHYHHHYCPISMAPPLPLHGHGHHHHHGSSLYNRSLGIQAHHAMIHKQNSYYHNLNHHAHRHHYGSSSRLPVDQQLAIGRLAIDHHNKYKNKCLNMSTTDGGAGVAAAAAVARFNSYGHRPMFGSPAYEGIVASGGSVDLEKGDDLQKLDLNLKL